jgi:hypothetical protein
MSIDRGGSYSHLQRGMKSSDESNSGNLSSSVRPSIHHSATHQQFGTRCAYRSLQQICRLEEFGGGPQRPSVHTKWTSQNRSSPGFPWPVITTHQHSPPNGPSVRFGRHPTIPRRFLCLCVSLVKQFRKSSAKSQA